MGVRIERIKRKNKDLQEQLENWPLVEILQDRLKTFDDNNAIQIQNEELENWPLVEILQDRLKTFDDNNATPIQNEQLENWPLYSVPTGITLSSDLISFSETDPILDTKLADIVITSTNEYNNIIFHLVGSGWDKFYIKNNNGLYELHIIDNPQFDYNTNTTHGVNVICTDLGGTLEERVSDIFVINVLRSFYNLESSLGNVVGTTLTLNTDNVVSVYDTSSPSFQWKRDGVNIEGETNQSYTATLDDVGSYISLDVETQYESAYNDLKTFEYTYITNDNKVLEIDTSNSTSYPGTGTTVYDLSGLNNNGTIFGDTYFDSTDNSFVFDGDADYISVPHSTYIKPQQITLFASAYRDDWHTSVRQRIFSTVNGNDGYTLDLWDGFLRVAIRIGSSWAICQHAVSNLPLSGWINVAGTYDGQSVILCIDGVQKSELSKTGNIVYDSDNYLIIGGDAGSGTGPQSGYYWNGKIARVLIYDRALTQTEVSQI